MPSLSTFYGLIIWMYKEIGGKHNVPHIHVQYGEENLVISLEENLVISLEENLVISLDGDVLEGSIPRNKKKLLDAWMEIHHDELVANWTLLSKGEKPVKIEPLR